MVLQALNHSLKNTLPKQKIELELRDAEVLVERRQAENLRSELQSSLIKVVTGPRRAGKSTLIKMALQGKRFAYANFEDELICVASTDEISETLAEVYGSADYFFFDEIQDYPQWELFM